MIINSKSWNLDMKFNILEYIGKVKDGVMTLITLEYNGVYYDATFYYTKDLVTLTIDDKLIDVMGHDIEDYENYAYRATLCVLASRYEISLRCTVYFIIQSQ